jgi:Mg2+/Co2+ transporter CorB
MFFPWAARTARVLWRRHSKLSGFILHGNVFINTDVSSVALHAVNIVLERKRNSLPAC